MKCAISPRPESSPDGFTFIEIMVILLIMGIMAMIGIPTLNGALKDSRLSGAADEIVTALEFAQITAMGSGANTRVTIDEDADTILLEQFQPEEDLLGGETELSENDVEGGDFVTMEYPANPGVAYQVGLADMENYSGVEIVSSAFGAGDFVIFDATGAPSSGGTIYLSCEGSQFVISLNSLNGKVSLSRL